MPPHDDPRPDEASEIAPPIDPEATPVEEQVILPPAAIEVWDVAPDPEPALAAIGPMVATTEHEVPAPADPGWASEIAALRDQISRRLDGLQSAFDRELRAEATREKVIDRLHAELQDYKQDLLLQVMRPVFIDLIQLHDDIGKMVGAQRPEAGEEVTRLLTTMTSYQQAIEDILYRQGVEPFEVDGEAFDPKRQRAVATVPTQDAATVRTIAARHRKGFRSGERVIRPEIVSVHAMARGGGPN